MRKLMCLVTLLTIPFTQELAPTFYLPDLNGNSFFASQHYGVESEKPQVTVISFFATWCAPCQKEIKALEQLKLKYPSVGFYLINYKETDDIILQWQRKMNTPLTILLDRYGRTATKFDVTVPTANEKLTVNLPTLFVISKEGKIIHTHSGFEEKDAKLLEEILETYED